MNARNISSFPKFSAPIGDVYRQRFAVTFEYPVHFVRRVFDPNRDELPRLLGGPAENPVRTVQVFVDEGLAQARPELPETIRACLQAWPASLKPAGPPLLAPGGEAAKNGWDTVAATAGFRALGGPPDRSPLGLPGWTRTSRGDRAGAGRLLRHVSRPDIDCH